MTHIKLFLILMFTTLNTESCDRARREGGARRWYRLRDAIPTRRARPPPKTTATRGRELIDLDLNLNLNHDARQRCANDDGDDGDAVGETTDGWKTHRRQPNVRCDDAADGGTEPSELFRPVHVVG